MAGWDGNGGWSWSYTWTVEAALGNPISSTKMDAQFADATAGFQNCLTRDGQGKPSANLDMNGFKWTNAAVGSAASDLATYGQLTGLATGNPFRKNLLANGDMQVWQSGAGGSASIAGTAARIRTADCWWAIRQGTTGYTVSQQTGEVGSYALKWQRNAANASTENMLLAQSLETVDCLWLKRAATALVVSFYAKKGANYSGGNLTIDVVRGTGSNQNVLDGYTGASTLATLAQALTTTLTRYSLVVSTDTSTNELGVRFTWTPTGVAGADDSVTIERVQLEKANAATDFDFVPFEETLRRCQRYYEKSFEYSTAPATALGIGTGEFFRFALRAGATTQGVVHIPFKVLKRQDANNQVFYNPAAANANARDETAGADLTIGGAFGVGSGVKGINFDVTGAAGTTVGGTIGVHWSWGDTVF